MKSNIEVNGVEYVDKILYDVLLKEHVELKSKNTPEPRVKDLIVINPMVSDQTRVMGMGSVKLGGTWMSVSVSTRYLQRALKTLEIAGIGDRIDLIFKEDLPIILGKMDKEKQTACGILIAPRIIPEVQEDD